MFGVHLLYEYSTEPDHFPVASGEAELVMDSKGGLWELEGDYKFRNKVKGQTHSLF